MKGLVRRIVPSRTRAAVRRVLTQRPGGSDGAAGGSQSRAVPIPPDLSKLTAYTMSGYGHLEKHYRLGEDVVIRGVPGDLVECGVCDGGSAAALAYGIGTSDRRIWLYDSFQGLPPTTGPDGELAARFVGACVGSEEKVRQALDLAHVAPERVVIRRGWFEETFKLELPDRIALLHLDCDWYDSVMLSLETFYDRVSDGGTILLDDFGHWEGCREAFYDFAQRRRIKPLVERFGHSQMFWIKDRTHNRDYAKWDLLDGIRGDSSWKPGPV